MTENTNPPAGPGDLQFQKAEFGGSAVASLVCAGCKQPIHSLYWKVGAGIVCEKCQADVALAWNAGGGVGRFFRAAAFGAGAAILGAAIWAGVTAVTHLQLGLIAIVVGLMVGAAVRSGARGRGGWLYQSLAMALAWIAIGLSFAPALYKGALAGDAERKPPEEASRAAEAPAAPASLHSPEDSGGARVAAGVLAVVLSPVTPALILFESKSPILALIFAFAVYEAWKLNKRRGLELSGPFSLAASGSSPVAPRV